MTEEPFDSNLDVESPESEESTPVEITPPPLPETGYETQVLEPEAEEELVVEESAVVITTPPVIPEIPKEELEMPSPFEQEQPEPITMGSSVQPESPVTPPVSPPGPAAAPPSGGAPKKNNTLLIVIIVVAVLLLCCCCIIFGVIVMNWNEIAWQMGLNLVQSLMLLVG